MDLQSLCSELEKHAVVELPSDELDDLLAAAELVREDDTHLAGFIRILSIQGKILIQEYVANDGRVLLRGFTDRQGAEAFVRGRLDTYERMWDGCGCKVHYFK